MENNQKYFHDQHDNEEFIGFFRKHWTKLVPATFKFIIFGIGLLIISLIMRDFAINNELSMEIYRTILIIFFILILIQIHKYLLDLLSWFLSVIIITDFRIIEVIKTVYLNDEKEAVDLRKVQNIQMRKVGFLRNILDYGRILFTLASILDAKEVRQVPNVSRWVKKMNQVRHESISKNLKDFSPKSNEISQVQKFIGSEIITDIKE